MAQIFRGSGGQAIALFEPQMAIIRYVGAAAAVSLAIAVPTQALAAVLTKWQFDPDTNRLEITIEAETTPRYFLLAEPPRIVIDLPNTDLGDVETQRTYTGAVRGIRLSQFQADTVRVVVELSPTAILSAEPVALQQEKISDTETRWVVRPQIEQVSRVTVPSSGSELPPAEHPEESGTTITVPSSPAPSPTVGVPAPEPSPAEAPASQQTATNSKISLPSGTQLVLRYPGEEALRLQAYQIRQEVLLLEEDLRAPSDAVVAAAGTPVVGYFQTSRTGTRFFAQAIALEGQYFPLNAYSDILEQAQRNPQERGAGVSPLPQTTAISPGQIIQIQLQSDWSPSVEQVEDSSSTP